MLILPVANKTVINYPYIKVDIGRINIWKTNTIRNLNLEELHTQQEKWIEEIMAEENTTNTSATADKQQLPYRIQRNTNKNAETTNTPNPTEAADGQRCQQETNTLYKEASKALIGDNKYHKILKALTLDMLDKNRDIFSKNITETTVGVLQQIRKDTATSDMELEGLAAVLLIPIIVIEEETTIVYYPKVASSPAEIPSHGMIIELHKTEKNKFTWSNQSLTKEYFDKYNKKPEKEELTLTNKEFQKLLQVKEDELPHIKDIIQDQWENEEIIQDIDALNGGEILPVQRSFYKAYDLRPRAEREELIQPGKAKRPREPTVKLTPPTQEFKLSAEIIKEHQSKDKFCNLLRNIILKQDMSYNIDKKQEKAIRRTAENVIIAEDGILVNTEPRRTRKYMNEKQQRVVLPISLLKSTLVLCHDKNQHWGETRSLQAIQNRFWRPAILGTPSLNKMTKIFLANCILCPLKTSARQNANYPLKIPIIPAYPGQAFAMDFLGPLQESKETRMPDDIEMYTDISYTYILSFVDLFSGLTTAYPCRRQTALEAVKHLEDLISIHGLMEWIVLDNASQFRSIVFQHTCQRLNIELRFILPYSPTSNAMVERRNLILTDSLKVGINEGPDWHRRLKWVTLLMNNAYTRSLQDTSHVIHYGKDAVLPMDIINRKTQLQNKYILGHDSKHEIGVQLQQRLIQIREQTEKRILQDRKRSQKQKTPKNKHKPTKVGDIILIRLPLKKGTPSKLSSQWYGYYRIIKINGYMVTVQTVGGTEQYSTHIRRIRHVDVNFEEYLQHWTQIQDQVTGADRM
jgi:hypothetical protein